MRHNTEHDPGHGNNAPPAPSAAPSVGSEAPVGAGAGGMEEILKRETHSSRAVASIIAAVLVAGLCGYALLETAVRAVGQPPWLVDPQTAAERVAANVSQEQVMVTVSRQHVQVNVRPTSGVLLSPDAVLAAVQDELADMTLSPSPDVRINVASSGVVGA